MQWELTSTPEERGRCRGTKQRTLRIGGVEPPDQIAKHTIGGRRGKRASLDAKHGGR
jgi:hypothetical protein